MRTASRLGLVLLAGLAMACSSPEERAEQAVEDARAALARGDRSAAVQALARLRETPPQTAREVETLAALLVAAGEAPEAVWVLEDGVRRFDAPSLRLALAGTLVSMGDAARARQVVEEMPADADAPQRARALMLRGQAELKLGSLEAALAAFAEAERDFPEQQGVRVPRIVALLQERRFDDAREALAAAREAALDPELDVLRQLEATLYTLEAREGDAERALAAMWRLVEEAPEEPALWSAYVQLAFAQRQHEEARARVEEALARDPDRIPLYSLLASIAAALGERDEAEAVLRDWNTQHPSPTAAGTLARFRAEMGEVDSALAALDEGGATFGEDPQLQVVRAEILLGDGRLDEAEQVVDALAEAGVDPRPVDLLRARLELERGEAQAARDRLERLVPELDDASSQFWLARALEMSGDAIGAERRYGIAAQRSASDPAGPLSAYRLARARADWRTALAYGQAALQRAPGRPDAWKATIAALVEVGETAQAEQLAGRALQVFPDDVDLHALRAAALRGEGRTAEALEAIEQGRAHGPEAPSLVIERALALAVSGEGERGLAELGEAAEGAPEVLELHQAHAMLLYHEGRADEGDAATERALALAPDDMRALRQRLVYRASVGRFEEARADAERYLARSPEDAYVHFVLGVACDRTGDTEAAAAAYRSAAELDPAAHAPLNNLADLLGRAGRLEEALEAAQQAYRRADDDPHVLDTLGWLYLKSGRVERSISLLEQAREVAPDLHAAQLHLAQAYREAGRADEARALLVALRPAAPEALRGEVDEALATLQ